MISKSGLSQFCANRDILSFISDPIGVYFPIRMRKTMGSRQKPAAAIALSLILSASAFPAAAPATERQERAQPVYETRATYCSAPRTPSGRVDVERLLSELVDVGANTYSFCIHAAPTDWDDLKLLLPRAREKGIRVWASIVPPSESPPRLKAYAEPFRLDYERWAIEFAKLSVQETNLVAWSIDDFTHNLKFYTPDYVTKMLEGSHRINPRLAFVPCCYYPTITERFVTNYCSLIDGILFPYRHESAGSNLKDPSLVETEVNRIKELVGPGFPVILDIYASAHSRLGATTADYVEQAMIAGKQAADGVMLYRHQDPVKDREKYLVVKKLFRQWGSGRAKPTKKDR